MSRVAPKAVAGPAPWRTPSLPDPVASSAPLYKQVRSAIVASLAAGEWKPGDMIPNERALATRYRVGISTVRAAIGELSSMKVLVRRQGRGTFVCREDERRNIYQFFHVVRDDGVRELPVSHLLSLRRGRASATEAEALQLPRDPQKHAIYRLRNLLTVGDVPVVLSDIVIPESMFPGLTEPRIRAGGPTLYAVFQTLYGINIVRTDEQLRAMHCDAASSRLLKLPAGEPVLSVRRVARTFHDVPVETRESLVRTTHYHYALARGNAAA